MPQVILAFLGRYWKPLVIISIFLVITGGAYVKGRRDEAKKMERAVARELEKRIGDVQRERDRTDKIRDNIRNDRDVTPINDSRDTCLLSNDPYRVNCLKEGAK